MLLYDPEQNSLHIMETKKLNVTWYVYTHESRMLLLASGMQCTVFSGYQVISRTSLFPSLFACFILQLQSIEFYLSDLVSQFSAAAGIVRLPKFEMSMTKSEANSKPVLSSDDVHIVTM